MKKNNTFISGQTALFSLAVCIFSIASCSGFWKTNDNSENSSTQSGTTYDVPVTIITPFASASLSTSESARTAIPAVSDDNFPVKKYTVTAGCETTTKAASITTGLGTTSSLKINLTEGTWTVTVNGYASVSDDDTAVICTGTGSVTVDEDGNGSASIQTTPSKDGNGTVSLSFAPGSDVTSICSAKAVLYKTDGTTAVEPQTFSNSGSALSGTQTINFDDNVISAGEYTLLLCCYNTADTTNDSTIIFERSETVDVWTGFITNAWIDHFTLASGETDAGTASLSETLTITSDMLSDTDTTFSGLAVSGSTTEVALTNSSAASYTYLHYMCGPDETVKLAVSLTEGKSVTVTEADGSTELSYTSVTGSTSGSGTELWTLSYTLPAPSLCDYVTVNVTAQNGIASTNYIVSYGPLYVDNQNTTTAAGDDTGYGTREAPYKTIAKAAAMLCKTNDTGTAALRTNRIVLLSNVTTNTEDSGTSPADGTENSSSLVSFTKATQAAPLVLTLDGSGTAGTSSYSVTAPPSCRVLYIENAYTTVTLSDITLTGDSTGVDNGGCVYNAGSLTMDDGTTLTDGTAACGGGVYNAGTFNMEGGIIKACNHCGIYNNGGTFTMNGGTITDNSAPYGGGVYNKTIINSGTTYTGTFNMNSGTISNNAASSNAGGIDNEGGTITINGGTISGNKAEGTTGGGINNYSDGSIIMSGGTISGNTAATSGGGVNLESGTFTMSGGTISGNKATSESGGGVNIQAGEDAAAGKSATFTMSGGTIGGTTEADKNKAPYGGGVDICSGGTFTMTNGTISGNTATEGEAGGIENDGGKINIFSGTISGNTATTYGGGIYNNNGAVTMEGGCITSNKVLDAVNYGGGGVYNGSTFVMSGSAVIDAETNDVYLQSGKYITVGTLSGTGTVAEITPTAMSDDTIILHAETSSTLAESVPARFILNVAHKGLALSSDKTSAVIAAQRTAVTLDGEPSALGLTPSCDSGTNTATITVTDSGTDVSSSVTSWKISILDSSYRSTGITASATGGVPSVVLGFTSTGTVLPDGTYYLYVVFTYTGIDYTATLSVEKS
jgi:hypothetical protein